MAKNIRIDENTSFNPENGEFINSNIPSAQPTPPAPTPFRNELRRSATDADSENLMASIGIGILWTLVGLFIGFIGGGLIGWVVSILYIIFANESPQAGDKVMETTMWIIIVICGIIGFFGGFYSKRE